MASMNISLSATMKDYVEKISTETGDYTNSSDYIRDLIRHDQVRREKIAQLQKLIDDGIKSGLSDKTPEQIRNDIKNRYENCDNQTS